MASTRPSAMQDAISRSQQGQLLTLHSLLPPAAEANDVLLEIAMRLRSEEGLRYDRRMMLNTARHTHVQHGPCMVAVIVVV